MKSRCSTLFLCLLCFSVSAFAEVGLSEGHHNRPDNRPACNCEQDCGGNACSCADVLPNVKISFDVDSDGATFEKYVNVNNPSEVGYRSCAEDCEIVVAGKCKADVNPTVTVTVTVTPEPTATVTPTPTPVPECNYYKGTLDSLNDKKNGKKDFQYGNETGLTCVDQKVQEFTNACYSLRYSNYYDDCIATKFSDTFFGGMKINNQYNKYRWNVNTAAEKSKLVGNAVVGSGNCTAADFNIHTGGAACLSGYFYFDKGCNAVSEEQVQEVCGDMDVTFKSTFLWSTPISLIWDKNLDLNSEVTFAKFNLDLGNGETAWYALKASEKAPLLVYDPNHSGEVKDASQLFGNWAFGGKRVASLASGNTQVVNGKWENGYEALASLDRDYDGQLSGDELSDLALWFDVNRDGVSQKGEVKSLSEAGVTELFFNGYVSDANGDLRLDVGYTRSVNGRAEQGASIDWQEVGAPSKLALADYYNSLNANENSEYDMSVNSGEELKALNSKFDGVWKWSIEEEDLTEDAPTSGTFIFNVVGNNQVKGYTLTERRFAASPDNQLDSFVTMNRISGEEKGNVLNFSAQVGNSFTNNEATLSADGKTISGKSEVVIAGGKTVSYSWKAVRSNN